MRAARHLGSMRSILILFLIFIANPGHADPRVGQCSSGKWGHVHCIRAEHFVYDTCNAIEEFSTRHDLDTGFFARLIWQESRFDPNALSHANARGIAQFIPSTARYRGLKDPYNPADALAHSAQYLAEMADKYGNEGMAAIGYNGGEGRAVGFLAGKGLAPETVNYVPIITGLKAEVWRDAPPEKPDFRLSKTEDFQTACRKMAQNRRISPLKPTGKAAPSKPLIKPWGVQLGFGVSKKAARAKVRQVTGGCRSLVAKEPLDLVFKKNRVTGRKGYYMARISRNSQVGAQSLCKRLRARGCKCLVLKN